MSQDSKNQATENTRRASDPDKVSKTGVDDPSYHSLIVNAEFPVATQNKKFRELVRERPLYQLILTTLDGHAKGPKTARFTGVVIVLCGLPGSGKTHLACEIGRRICRAGSPVFFSDATEMLRRFKNQNVDWENFEEQFFTSRLLILDNVDGMQAWQQADIARMVNRRIDANRWTILITNAAAGNDTKTELGQHLVNLTISKGRTIEVSSPKF